MGEQLHVSVSYNPAIGYISTASPRLPRSLCALSLEGLRRQITVAFPAPMEEAGPAGHGASRA